MTFLEAFHHNTLLMEGALGERLKREYALQPDEHVALAAHVYHPDGRKALETLWQGYARIAQQHQMPFLATTPTRRANRERVACSSYGEEIIADNVRFLKEVRGTIPHEMCVGALLGCKGDAYLATDVLSEQEAERFHIWSVERFAKAGVDFFYAGIMPALTEAAGMALAIESTGIPYIISFMLRANGRLADGTTLHDAIAYIEGITNYHPVCYMTNCIHPDVLYHSLSVDDNRSELVQTRFCGIQVNTSALPPEALDGSPELHLSRPDELADSFVRLRDFIELKIIGGCCGTDEDYMNAIADRASRQ